MRPATVGAFVLVISIMALAIGIAGCTQEDITDIIVEDMKEDAQEQVDQRVKDIRDTVNSLFGGGGGGDDDGSDTTATPVAAPTPDPAATPTPKPIFPPAPTPVPLTDADNAIHITATLDVLVIDKDSHPVPDKMVWFNGISWVEKDPRRIMLMKPTDENGRASFTVGYDLINNREKFARLGSPDYVDYLAMAATTCNPIDPEGKAGTPLYIDVYATDHWTMIQYTEASAQAGALKYAAITRSLTLRLLPINDQGYGPFQYQEYGSQPGPVIR